MVVDLMVVDAVDVFTVVVAYNPCAVIFNLLCSTWYRCCHLSVCYYAIVAIFALLIFMTFTIIIIIKTIPIMTSFADSIVRLRKPGV